MVAYSDLLLPAQGEGAGKEWLRPSNSDFAVAADSALWSDDDLNNVLKYDNVQIADHRLSLDTGDADVSTAEVDQMITTVSPLPSVPSMAARKGKGRKSGTNRRKTDAAHINAPADNSLRTYTVDDAMMSERHQVTSYAVMTSSSVKEQLCNWRSWKKTNDVAGLKTIYVGGLFELTGDVRPDYGCTELAAAYLALQHVNEQRVIPGYQLDIRHNDTRVSIA